MKETLDNLLADIRNLQNAAELLERIWNSLSPYTDKIDAEIWKDVRDHFGFDDSE